MSLTCARSLLIRLATCAIASSTVSVALSQTSAPTTSPTATTKPEPTLLERLDKEFEKYQIPLVVAGVAGIVYLGVFWLKPIWLLRLPSTSLALPWTSWKVPLSIVKPLKYRNRVLDA